MLKKGDDIRVQIEDPPAPNLDDLEQREPVALPSVPVTIEGPVRVQNLPARFSSATSDMLPVKAAAGAVPVLPVRILSEDPRRTVATILCVQDWRYMTSRTGVSVFWPKNVPMVVTHMAEVYAVADSAAGEIGVIAEFIGN